VAEGASSPEAARACLAHTRQSLASAAPDTRGDAGCRSPSSRSRSSRRGILRNATRSHDGFHRGDRSAAGKWSSARAHRPWQLARRVSARHTVHPMIRQPPPGRRRVCRTERQTGCWACSRTCRRDSVPTLCTGRAAPFGPKVPTLDFGSLRPRASTRAWRPILFLEYCFDAAAPCVGIAVNCTWHSYTESNQNFSAALQQVAGPNGPPVLANKTHWRSCAAPDRPGFASDPRQRATDGARRDRSSVICRHAG
jgi:hypothetical protein